jgi:hypothetical protein
VTTQGKMANVGVLWRGDPQRQLPTGENNRLHRIFEELGVRRVATEPVVFSEEVVEDVRRQLLSLDGVLVWVDPIVDGRDRAALDALLRDVASRGIWVSAHPDVILSMGAKDVLVRTRDMEWGTDTHLYHTADELGQRLPALLRSSPRVLKQLRGNGGNGVWRVRLLTDASQPADSTVEVLHALRGSQLEQLRLGDFIERCAAYFAGTGCVIDQPYQTRLSEGMIRCYMVHDRVVGFGHQFVTALLQPPPGSLESPPPPPRLYYGPGKEEFQDLKTRLESRWIGEMQQRLDVSTYSLPVIWDADFLLGPQTESGADTYVLCEINVSSVFPIPEEAPSPLAEAAVARVLWAKRLCQRSIRDADR